MEASDLFLVLQLELPIILFSSSLTAISLISLDTY